MDNTERYRKLDVDGLKITVDTVKTGSWSAFQLLRKAREADSELAQFDALAELVAFATDVDLNKIVDHLGGDDAQYVDVVRIMAQVAVGCYPKN